VNRDVGGYCSGFDSAEPFIRAEFTSRTPEIRRSPSIRESSSSSRLPLPKTSSASSSSAADPGRTTMRSKGTSASSLMPSLRAAGTPTRGQERVCEGVCVRGLAALRKFWNVLFSEHPCHPGTELRKLNSEPS
jgi:hypothetical protein